MAQTATSVDVTDTAKFNVHEWEHELLLIRERRSGKDHVPMYKATNCGTCGLEQNIDDLVRGDYVNKLLNWCTQKSSERHPIHLLALYTHYLIHIPSKFSRLIITITKETHNKHGLTKRHNPPAQSPPLHSTTVNRTGYNATHS